jgi:nucleotide-binding universal stress UspA family protein
MRFLIYLDSHPETEHALAVAARLAKAAGAAVTLLAVTDDSDNATEAAQKLLAEARQHWFPAAALKTRAGRAAREILAEAATGDYGLIVIRSRGRRGWLRAALGSLSGRVARYAPIPVLIVNEAPRAELKHLLACTGGGPPGERVARWGGRWAGWLGANFTILHVMSQMAIATNADEGPLRETAEEAIAAHTREGEHLRRELDLAHQAGAMPEAVHPKIRHGLVVDEVLAEVNSGNYDAVVIGGHQAPSAAGGFGPLRAFLLEDLADQIIADVRLPILVIKGQV